MARTDYYGIQTPVLQATSQAIRTVNGTVGTIAPEDYPDLISAMHSQSDYDNVMAQLIEETASGAVVSFADGANNIPVKELIASIEPIQSGSGTPSPDNVRPISGRTSSTLTHIGKNLWEFEKNQSITRDKTFRPSLPAGTYTMSFDFVSSTASPAPTTMQMSFVTSGGTVYNPITINTSGKSVRTFTLANDATAIMIYASSSYSTSVGVTTVIDNIQLERGSTATDYAPYVIETHTTDFGQTVYGGSLNLTTGLLTIDKAYHQFSEFTWTVLSSTDKTFITSSATDKAAYNANMISDIYQTVPVTTPSADAPDGSIKGVNASSSQYTRQIVVKDSRYSTAEDFSLGTANNVVVYDLKTTTTIQLTPTEVNTLLGANNIYHDCNGNTEVTYRANGGLYVAQH